MRHNLRYNRFIVFTATRDLSVREIINIIIQKCNVHYMVLSSMYRDQRNTLYKTYDGL
jgi:hypothetical protein